MVCIKRGRESGFEVGIIAYKLIDFNAMSVIVVPLFKSRCILHTYCRRRCKSPTNR